MADTEDILVERLSSDAIAALEPARRVLETEISGLQDLSRALDDRFTQALAVLDNVQGRVIVTGMGKSGHIARKMAATLASTGTPAQYVHPGEASHGDLGMITTDDAVIAMSNSGETAELSDIVAYVKLKRIPFITITGRADSGIAKAADVSLVVPDSPEACPLSLAPTTSTTVMLALGDAIAVTLLFTHSGNIGDRRVQVPQNVRCTTSSGLGGRA